MRNFFTANKKQYTVSILCMHNSYIHKFSFQLGHVSIYRIEQNFGGKKIWRNCDFETLAEKTLANPRFACMHFRASSGMLAKKTWRIVAIRQSFLPAKVLFYTVSHYYAGCFVICIATYT